MIAALSKIAAVGSGVILFVIACASPNITKEAQGASSRLQPCPDSPNCVSSLSQSKHRIEPFRYEGDRRSAFGLLEAIIASHKQARIVSRSDDYLRAQYTSAFFGFVDDVEFWFPPDESVIHVRSASRTGYYDFGVNRRRIERIRTQIKEAGTARRAG